MTLALIAVAAVLGLAAGPLLADVARRVFVEPPVALLERDDAVTLAQLGGRGRPWPDRLVQIGTAAVFAVGAHAVGGDWSLPAFLWFGAVTIVLTLTDLDRKLIPNRITLPGALIGAGLLGLGALAEWEWNRLWWMTLGALGYMAFMAVLAMIVPGGLGFGDVKLAAILGAFLGYARPAYVIVGVVGAYVIGGAASLLLLVTRIKSRKDTIPFGPYMVAGAYAAWWFGGAIIDWYLG
jgi:leader peptidase (prepilin peptidase)/N-methyltransferase